MIRVFLLLAILITGTVQAQMSTEQEAVKKTINTFFNGFHKQDSVIMKSVVYNEISLQSIGKNREGVVKLNTSDFSKFLKSIVSIPKDKKFEEKLINYNIQIDGNMANAWTDYEFWFNGQFSHCGVNSFQLIKEDKQWKIFYLVDTRRRADCKE